MYSHTTDTKESCACTKLSILFYLLLFWVFNTDDSYLRHCDFYIYVFKKLHFSNVGFISMIIWFTNLFTINLAVIYRLLWDL